MKKNLALLSALFISACGGSGGGESSTPVAPEIEGRWVGSVFIDPKQECFGPGTIDLSGRSFAFDIDPSAANGLPLVLDQDGAFFLGDPVGADNSFFASALNQSVSLETPSGATGLSFSPIDRTTANVSLFVFYNRFCSSRFNGTFTRSGAAADPKYADIKATWKGTLTPVLDDCNIGASLNETHQVAFDGINVSLVSNDNRLLTGKWKTISSFSVETGTDTSNDTVVYDNIANNVAQVTITHFDGTALCSTVWQGTMQR